MNEIKVTPLDAKGRPRGQATHFGLTGPATFTPDYDYIEPNKITRTDVSGSISMTSPVFSLDTCLMLLGWTLDDYLAVTDLGARLLCEGSLA